MRNPYSIVADLEAAISEYTGAPYVVCVNSCTMALLLAVRWFIKTAEDYTGGSFQAKISIPKHTYVSVPMSIVHAGGWPVFRDEDWKGCYRLEPLPVWDCARYFTSNMYLNPKFEDGNGPRDMLCVSFHTTKILGDTQGGAILLDDPDAAAWLKRMRFDGRKENWTPKMQAGQGYQDSDIAGIDRFTEIGYHCYMSPDVAARLLHRINFLPKHNDPLPNDDYPDLSLLEIFK